LDIDITADSTLGKSTLSLVDVEVLKESEAERSGSPAGLNGGDTGGVSGKFDEFADDVGEDEMKRCGGRACPPDDADESTVSVLRRD
jgi:hypothetical protein